MDQNNMLHYLKQLPIQLTITIVIAFFLGSILDVFYVSLFYSISSCIIETLIFVLPIMIFGFIFRALVNSPRSSLWLVLLIFIGVTLSNSLALITSYFFSTTFLPFLGLAQSPDLVASFTSDVSLLFSLHLPKLIGTEKAMALGIAFGVVVSLLNDSNNCKIFSQKASSHLYRSISLFLEKVFIPVLPLYVFGFCIKLSYDEALIHLFHQFGKVFLLSTTLVCSYLFLLYFLGSGATLKRAMQSLKTMLPAGLTGFSTMSSAATMPVTLRCTEENTKDRDFTNLIIPSTTNIHMLGDDLTLVMVALTLLSVFGHPWPDFISFLPFVFAFALAKLSCVGVPGASVLVVLPVMQHHLGFTPEMVSILTTLYILQDSFGTAANVMGNGAFALLIQRVFVRLKTLLKAKTAST